MNKTIIASLLAGVSMSFMAGAAHAENATIANALASRTEVSQFYTALQKTGVIDEIPSGSVTVFAPNNAAFAKLTQREYPCLYSPQCTEEVAAILRNHIAPHEVHVKDAVRGAAVFSIDKTHLHLHEPQKGRYTVEGKKVLSQNQLVGSMLYIIDGVIADKDELADLREPPAPLVIPTPVTTTQETVTKEYRYRDNGAPAATVDSTTTIRRTETPATIVQY